MTFNFNLPTIGIKVVGSCELADSSIMTCEKCFGSGFCSFLAKFPAVHKVQMSTRNEYKNPNAGIGKMPLTLQFEIFLKRSFIFLTLYDEVYNRNISSGFKTSIKRSVISSHAALEFAQTKTYLSVDRTISSMALTNVFVLPVPMVKNSFVCLFKLVKR